MPRSSRSPEERLAAEALAVKELKKALGNDADDAELFRDMVEGETSLFEMIDAIHEEILKDEELRAGIKARKQQLDARDKRIGDRINWRRAKIELALFAFGADEKIERPEATFFLTQRPASVIVTSEESIPAKYWKAGDPVLDKKLLKADLDAKVDIPGATLSNAPTTLTIRST